MTSEFLFVEVRRTATGYAATYRTWGSPARLVVVPERDEVVPAIRTFLTLKGVDPDRFEFVVTEEEEEDA